MRSRSISGFGLLQVMIGTVVLGIFAMVFVRKAQNRADVSLLTELITYRDQVLDYYSAVVQSRTAWQCTRKCGSPTTANQGFNLYDGDGECQGGCPTTKTLRLPSQGWRFSNKVAFSPPSAFPSPPGDADNPFFVQATWQRVNTANNEVKVTVSVNFSPNIEWKKDYTTMDIGDRKRVFYMNRTPYKNCSDGLASGFSGRFFDDGGSGAGVERYAGDTAVVAIDATTGLVNCWNSPLVIPPCYDLSNPPFSSNHSNRDLPGKNARLDFVAAENCGATDKGLCPRTSLGGTTGITHFDRATGISHCAQQHILVVERNGVSEVNCGSIGSGGLVGFSGSGDFLCSNRTGTIRGSGVKHNEGSDCDHGIRGWDGSGNIVCANIGSDANIDYGVNFAFRDGYWVGDKGDKGCEGDKIRTCNCCEYPQHCTNSWVGCTTNCVDTDDDDRNLENEFKGCISSYTTCYWSQNCRDRRSCHSDCGNCLSRRVAQYKPCSDHDDECNDCERRNDCDAKDSSYARCDPDTDPDDCENERKDSEECCDDECSNRPTCNLEDCTSSCHDTSTNDCEDQSFSINCEVCLEYDRDCRAGRSESRKFKNELPTIINNPTTGCSGSIYSNPSARTSCP